MFPAARYSLIWVRFTRPLMRLEQRGLIRGKWGATETKRKARFYEITAAGKRQLEREKQAWERMAGIIHTLLYSEG
jgi:PadR family transcriptional regulator, regulatory protein PadR